LVHRAALPRGTRALLVDDWSESGSTVLGVKALVDAAEAELTAVSFLVDSLTDDARATLSRGKVAVHALTTAAALPQAA
ncbi:MAG: phosphoribosyltransferase, partial [Stackebrandtia sp.]